MTQILNLQVSQIIPGNNDRRDFDPIGLQELAASISEHGLAQPITVRPHPGYNPDARDDDGGNCTACGEAGRCTCHFRFEIVAGERRFRAVSQILKLETIPAIVRHLSDEEASAIMLVENTSRTDLNPIEEANAYNERRVRFGWDIPRISKVAGVSEDLIKRRLSLISLIPDAQHLVANGHLPIGHAEAITDLDSNRQRIAIRIHSESEGMSLRIFKGIVGQLLQEQDQDGLFDLENFWIDQVQQDTLPTRGKRAIVDVPTRSDIPELEFINKMSASGIILQYIKNLETSGFNQEAATIGTLFQGLVKLNFMSIPA